ncbi:hypothetical protein EXIGLDRAFT_374776 [Exidia glandulosa HHB12029]|uniref:Uncharacterized protein n=1 Tax=Exidia glandulosa HHB12029 TaxID=1314781 RepID=A0A165PZ13_EXIGL|nr:hypothetical protein EXIGLDRAFT_374776 [Exidia glandulosa HHB12029]
MVLSLFLSDLLSPSPLPPFPSTLLRLSLVTSLFTFTFTSTPPGNHVPLEHHIRMVLFFTTLFFASSLVSLLLTLLLLQQKCIALSPFSLSYAWSTPRSFLLTFDSNRLLDFFTRRHPQLYGQDRGTRSTLVRDGCGLCAKARS